MSKNYSKIVLSVTALLLIITMIVAGGADNDIANIPTESIPEQVPDNTESAELIEDEIICDDNITYKKPVVYLYPEQKTTVSVKLDADKIICSYPKYNNGWNVIAHPDGTLIDLETNRELYALYYEADIELGCKISRTGFVVDRDELIPFFEEKLDILGLTEKEANEFIIYWLPILEQNEYNYIYFATNEDLDKTMPLEIYPAPDTLIRICMYYVGLEEPIKFAEQTLEPVERKGFTVVEWGGAELAGILPFRPKMPCGGIKVPPYRLPRLGGHH